MTLAAALILNGVPVVMSDLLITFERGPEDRRLSLPATGPLPLLSGPRRMIHGLRQKLFIVANNLVIAYASGDVDRTVAGLEGLRSLAATRSLAWDEVETFLLTRRSLAGDGFVGFFAEASFDGNFRIRRIQVRGESFITGNMGVVDAVGSGVDLLREACGRIGEFGTLPSGFQALSKVASMCGFITRWEHAVQEPVTLYSTGGAFEIAYFRGGKFQKAELTFAVWDAEVEGGNIRLKGPFVMIKTKYLGDVLLIDCARADCEATQNAFVTYKLHTHICPPPYSRSHDPTVALPKYIDFSSQLTQHSILISRGEDRDLTCLVETGPSGLSPVDAQGGFHIPIPVSPGLLDSLCSAIDASPLGRRTAQT